MKEYQDIPMMQQSSDLRVGWMALYRQKITLNPNNNPNPLGNPWQLRNLWNESPAATA